MAIATIQFFSRALNRHVEYNALLPESGNGPFPVVMQLHGLTDNHWSWIHRSRFIHDLEREPVIVILPDGGTSAYVDWPAAERLGKQDYETFLTRDLVAHVRRHFQAMPSKWGIGGLSMGGYGAMRLGLRHPDLFASVWAHSSAFHIHNMLGEAAGGDRVDLGEHAGGRPADHDDFKNVLLRPDAADDALQFALRRGALGRVVHHVPDEFRAHLQIPG